MLLFVCMFVRVRKCWRKFYPLCVLWLPEEISSLVAALWCWHDTQTSARTHAHIHLQYAYHICCSWARPWERNFRKGKALGKYRGPALFFPGRRPWPVSLCTCDQFLHRAWPQGAPDSCVQSSPTSMVVSKEWRTLKEMSMKTIAMFICVFILYRC